MSSKRSGIAVILGALATLSLGQSYAAATATTPAASIPFANHGGISNWQADNDRGLWVQANSRQWYYAKFMGPCIGVDFAESVGFDTHPLGTFDRFSAVIVPKWGTCQLQSFEVSDGPPRKHQAAG